MRGLSKATAIKSIKDSGPIKVFFSRDTIDIPDVAAIIVIHIFDLSTHNIPQVRQNL